ARCFARKTDRASSPPSLATSLAGAAVSSIFPSSLPACFASGFICSEFSLLRYEASVDDERGTDREFRVVGRKIENRCCDLLGGAYSPRRGNRAEGIAHLAFLSGKTIKHVSRDDARGDGVDADVLFGELERNRLGEAFDCVFGGDVDADLPQSDVTSHAGIIDDRAAAGFEHRRDFVAHRIQDAPNVDVENAPILSLGSLIERAFPFNAGIVKSNVEPSEFVDGEVDHRFNV